jgi:hypothetical protein
VGEGEGVEGQNWRARGGGPGTKLIYLLNVVPELSLTAQRYLAWILCLRDALKGERLKSVGKINTRRSPINILHKIEYSRYERNAKVEGEDSGKIAALINRVGVKWKVYS